MSLITVAKEESENIADTLEPEGDWCPVLLAKTNRGVLVLAIPDFDLSRVGGLQKALVEVDTSELALVVSGWATTQPHEPDEDGFALPPSMREDRQESLIIAGGSEPEQIESWMAQIHRHPDSHPTLGEWSYGDQTLGRVAEFLGSVLASRAKN